MEQDNTTTSAPLTQEQRIKLIKDQRRKLHEERLKKSNLFFTSTTPSSSDDKLSSTLTSSSSLDQQTKTGVLRKPTIPYILRSATEPVTGAYNDHHHHDASAFNTKKPSILKKKDDNTACSSNTTTTTTTVTSTTSNQPTSVTFGLSVSKSMLTRTKSIDSNLSGDTETGYWSGGENSSGILKRDFEKGRRNNLDGDNSSDQSSILKLRRSSLGSSIGSSGSEGGLQSILKRKLSYDSSYIMKKESNPMSKQSSEYSFSTHSLPACGCLSPEPKKPILKKKSSSEDVEEMERKPILKHRNFPDNHEFSVEGERIKPCLMFKSCLKKKASSKSADECFPSSNVDSSSARYSPIFNDAITQHSNTNKGILKKGGILKNTWRESSSTSNSSSSSDIENLRSFHPDDPSENLRRSGRFFCSDSNLDSSENNNMDSIMPSNTSDMDTSPLTPYPDDRYDALTVENGLTSNHPIGRLHVTSTESTKNIDSTTSSYYGKVDCENNQTVSVFGPRKKTLPVKTLPSSDKKTTEEEPFKLKWRRNSCGTSIQLHNLVYGKSSETQEEKNQNSTRIQAETVHNMGTKVERTDSHEDIVMSLTVAEKRSLFMQLENECRQASICARRNAAERGAARAKRYTTQPVTTDEVEKAAAMMVQNQAHHGNTHDDGTLSLKVKTTEKNVFVTPRTTDNEESHEAFVSPPSSSLSSVFKGLKRYQHTPISQSLDSGSLVNVQKSGDELKCPTGIDSDLSSSTSQGALQNDGTGNYNMPVTAKPPSGAAFSRRKSCSRAQLPRTDDGHGRIDLEVQCIEQFPSNLKDKIRMFDVFASTVQLQSQRVIKRPVTSRRYSTQPVMTSFSTVQLEECGRSGAARIVGADSTDGASSSIMRKKTNVATASFCEDNNKSTVRDEEGQIDESECSKSVNAISGGVSLPQDRLSSKVVNSCQDFTRETTRCGSSSPEMPEKILPVSDDLSISSDDNKVNVDDDEDSEDRNFTPAGEFSRGKRKLRKSSSANSMMMSTESDLNLFQKSKGNRTSIADKIAALQTTGESWKKKQSKLNLDKEKIVPTDQNDNLELRKNNKDSSIIASKLSQLTNSQEGWKKRVGGENDASIYTVQGRLEKAGKIVRNIAVPEVSTSPTKGLKLTQLRFQNRGGTVAESTSNIVSPVEDSVKPPVKTNKQLFRPPDVSSSSSESSEEEKIVRSVIRNDNETFQSFFSDPLSVMGKSLASNSSVQIEESSFTAIQSENRKLLGLRRNVKAPRNHSHITNPVKSLAARLESLDQSYLELNPEVREKEMIKRRIQMDNSAKQTHLSIEALAGLAGLASSARAGLASKEDFTSVRLKKAAGSELHNKEYPHPMLIRIRGKRHVQSRLVSPQSQSITTGDNYILVTANKLFKFIGEYSNRLERAKVADVVSSIVQKKDLGISSRTEVVTLEEPLLSGGRDRNQFFQILGGEMTPKANLNDLGDESDRLYENAVISTNQLYEIDEANETLVPLRDVFGWGSQPRYAILLDDKVLVFDFGSEMYVWSGCKADPVLKKTGFRLAKKLFADSYDFTGIDAAYSPIGNSLQGKRPSWCWLKKINQHMEPITFIEKFFDWPDDSGRLIKVQQKRNSDVSQKEANYKFKPCNVDEMIEQLEKSVADPPLEVEGFDVGRGCDVRNPEDGRTYNITTLDVHTWNISKFSKCDGELGHFYSQETYVIRWQLSVTQVGRDLKGNKSRHCGVLGRERYVYFFWQGKDSKITEQGTSALMTIELDKERGAQIRVEQGREHPAFLSLFKGLMLIHLGSKETSTKDYKLYVAMGACENEGHFIEVALEASSFRSLGSFILVDYKLQCIYLWNGSLSNSVTRKVNLAANGAANFLESPRKYLNSDRKFTLIELEEGDETVAFLSCFQRVPNALKWAESYVCLSGRSLQACAKVDVFAFSSLLGIFEATPVFSPKRKTDSLEAFPLLQDQLYHYHQQPKLFLVSRGPETWLWQGWTPRGDEENENTSTGSSELRWAAEQKAAFETTIEFCRKRGTSGYVISAGLEPPLFKSIFPYWNLVQEAQEANLAEGITTDSAMPVEEALAKLLKTGYTSDELQDRPEEVHHIGVDKAQ